MNTRFMRHVDGPAGPRNGGGLQWDVAVNGPYLYWDWYWADWYNGNHGGIGRVRQDGTHRRMSFINDPHAEGIEGLAVAPG